jgi:predicted nucleotidyltransferase component of viral defense system
MIGRDEILRLAGELGLRPDVVEKDYVLGWMPAGIFHDEVFAPVWVFKGGTCERYGVVVLGVVRE